MITCWRRCSASAGCSVTDAHASAAAGAIPGRTSMACQRIRNGNRVSGVRIHRLRRGYHETVQRSRDGRAETSDGQRPQGRARQRAFLNAALPDSDEQALAELRELLRTAGVAGVGELVQRRDQPHPNTYLGAGKLEE